MHRLALLPPVAGLVFEEAGHRYYYHDRVFGKLLAPSVSQIMDATGVKTSNWSAWRHRLMTKGLTEQEGTLFNGWEKLIGVPLTCERDADLLMEQWRKHRAAVGTEFHALSQGVLLGTACQSVIPEALRIFCNWSEEWYPKVQELRICEQPMIHPAAFYTGTPDFCGTIVDFDDGPVLVDWKTCLPGKAKVRNEWQLQQGAYAELIRANYGIEIRRGINLILWDGGIKAHIWNRADLQQGWAKFAGFLAEYHAREALNGSIPHRIALTALSSMFP